MADKPLTGPNDDQVPPSFAPGSGNITIPDAVEETRNIEQDIDDRNEEKAEKRSSWFSSVLEFVTILVIALVISVLIKTFLLQTYYVPSGSMETTLQVDDRIAVNRMARDVDEIGRGDIVVFVDPGGWLPDRPDRRTALQRGASEVLQAVGLLPRDTGHHLVKRVIGVGGDTVECCTADGQLSINGVPLDEEYVIEGAAPSEQPFSVTVPEGHLWVMGDNRPNSSDSRFHNTEGNGFVPIENVEGRAWAIFFPFDHFGKLDKTHAFDAVAGEASGAAGAESDAAGSDSDAASSASGTAGTQSSSASGTESGAGD
ncbi:MAG: signal peptidase I [Ancrocorticia sp.]